MIRTFTCERCGKQFDKAWYPSRDKPKFCSHSCRKKREFINCSVCGKKFESHSCRDRKYCSKQCKFIGTRRKEKVCLFCGKKFNNTNKKYCSYKCSVNHRQSLVTKNFCEYCGKIIDPEKSMKHRKYCSKECSSKNQIKTGVLAKENNPNWKGGLSSDRGENWRQQSNLARKRDNYTCQQCGKQKFVKPFFHVHHIIPFREFGLKRYKEANRLENLITLCASCHMKIESKSPYHFPIASVNKHFKVN